MTTSPEIPTFKIMGGWGIEPLKPPVVCIPMLQLMQKWKAPLQLLQLQGNIAFQSIHPTRLSQGMSRSGISESLRRKVISKTDYDAQGPNLVQNLETPLEQIPPRMESKFTFPPPPPEPKPWKNNKARARITFQPLPPWTNSCVSP